MAITNERIRQMVFDAQTNPTDKFIVLALEALLESQVGAGATDAILDTFIPVAPTTQLVMFGHKLGDFSGLSRTQIKALFTKADGSALVDADVDAIFAALGATEGLGVMNPFGSDEGTDQVADLPSEEFQLEAAKSDEEFVDTDIVVEKETKTKKGEKSKSS